MRDKKHFAGMIIWPEPQPLLIGAMIPAKQRNYFVKMVLYILKVSLRVHFFFPEKSLIAQLRP
jgi:hypothetical protein